MSVLVAPVGTAYLCHTMRGILLRNRWATLLVVGLLLFGTSGVGLTRMTCFSGGHSVLSFGAGADCCPAPLQTTGASLKAECCDVQLAQSDLSDLLPSLQLEWTVGHATVVDLPWDLIVEASANMVGWLKGRAPPGTVLQRLARLGQYRI